MAYDPNTLLPAYVPSVPSASLLDDGHEDDLHELDRQELRGLKSSLGLGSSNTTPVAGTVRRATGTGTAEWGAVQAGDLAATATMKKIAEVSGTGAGGVMEVSSIPATYRHLLVMWHGRSDVAGTSGDIARLTVEASPTAGAYNNLRLIGAGSSTVVAENLGAQDWLTVGSTPSAGCTAGLIAGGNVWLHDYASTTLFKNVMTVGSTNINLSTGQLQVYNTAGIITLTAAISRIRITLASGNWTSDSQMTVYGIPG